MKLTMLRRHRLLVLICSLVLTAVVGPAGLAPKVPVVAGCTIFPGDNIWNARVDTAPLDPHSSIYLRSIGLDKPLHPDFGSASTSGIPYNVVPATERRVTVQVPPDESDIDAAPIPANPAIEGGEDRHLIVVESTTCRLYEFFSIARSGSGGWAASSAAYFDLRSNALRPDGWTSADAAGLPIFAGLVRYDEVAEGEIRHAIRFTAPRTRRGYVWPARHFASLSADTSLPPMGLRVRLKADVDISQFSREARVILTALKTYGMMLADNGQPWFITGAPHASWDGPRLTEEMRRITGAQFEVVDVSSFMRGPNSGAVLDPRP
jgi:hypothetical protein